MSAVPAPKRFSAEEYYKLGELGFLSKRTELIEGEILEKPPIGSEHAVVSDRITRLLIMTFGVGYVVRVANPLDLGDSQPQPDFAIVSGVPEDFRGGHPKRADLVIEVSVTSTNFDRDVKSRIYGSALIPEYWIVDVANDRVEVRREPREGIGYSEIHLRLRGDDIVPLVDSTLRIRVDDLLSPP